MKVKLKDLINTQEAYGNLIKQNWLPVQIRYSLSEDGKKIIGKFETYSNERQTILEKYGKKNKDGSLAVKVNGQIQILDVEMYTKELDELEAIEVELNTEPILLKILLDERSTLSAQDMMMLDWIIKVEKGE